MKLFFVFCILCPSFIFSQTVQELKEKAQQASEKKNFMLALEYIEQAIRLDSTNVLLYETKGNILVSLKKENEAVDAYTKGISIKPISLLYLSRGNILLSNQFIDEAISDYNTGLKYVGTDSIAMSFYVSRGIAKSYKRDFEGAYKDLIYAYNMDTSAKYILSNLSDVCTNLNRKDEALKYLQIAYKANANDEAVLINLGYFYQGEENYKKSIEYFDLAIKVNPESPLALSNRSYSRMKTGNLNGAMEDINKSIKLCVANSYAYKNRGLIWLEMKRYSSACEDFHTAIKRGYTEMWGKDVQELIDKKCGLFK